MAYVVVMLTDAVMRVDGTGEKISELHRRAGETYTRPTGVEHDVMNGSDTKMAFIEIELKN